MKTNYGNSFANSAVTINADRVALWAKVDEMLPGGAFIPVAEATPLGTKIPAGTPISVDKIGGTATLNGSAPQGCTLEDAYVSEGGCSVAVVTKGQLNESVSEATYTATQKGKLTGITFYNL